MCEFVDAECIIHIKLTSPCHGKIGVYFSCQSQGVAAIVFGDGSESRLYPLTKRRSEGAIPIAANYRLIDAVVSNCINSNINRVYALTQFNSTSLNSHLSRAYSGAEGFGDEGVVQVIAAYQGVDDKGWFQVNNLIAFSCFHSFLTCFHSFLAATLSFSYKLN